MAAYSRRCSLHRALREGLGLKLGFHPPAPLVAFAGIGADRNVRRRVLPRFEREQEAKNLWF